MSKPAASNTLRSMLEHWSGLRLPPTVRLVLTTYWAHADWSTGQNARPSVATVARLSGYSRGTVQRALRLAEKAGALALDRPGGGLLASTYRVILPTGQREDPPRSAAPPASARGP